MIKTKEGIKGIIAKNSMDKTRIGEYYAARVAPTAKRDFIVYPDKNPFEYPLIRLAFAGGVVSFIYLTIFAVL